MLKPLFSHQQNPGGLRPAAVAGRFYPADPAELRHMIERCLAGVKSDIDLTPKAIIAPHAGYIYSGQIAASAYALLKPLRARIRRVVLIGPSHFVELDRVAGSTASAFNTPLGPVPVDQGAYTALSSLSQFTFNDEAHAGEHSLEVQLPFLQMLLSDFNIVPLVSGDVPAKAVAEILNLLWGGPETLVVASSDLSHYYDSQTARQLDTSTAAAIVEGREDELRLDAACGRIGISGLLQMARERHLTGKLLDLRNSGDTAGPRDQVVGYGAFAFQ